MNKVRMQGRGGAWHVLRALGGRNASVEKCKHAGAAKYHAGCKARAHMCAQVRARAHTHTHAHTNTKTTRTHNTGVSSADPLSPYTYSPLTSLSTSCCPHPLLHRPLVLDLVSALAHTEAQHGHARTVAERQT